MNGNIFLRPGSIQQEFCLGKTATYERIRELEEWARKGRYPRHAVIHDGRITLVNKLALVDFMSNRTMLLDKNLSRKVPAYDPEEIAKNIGYKRIGEGQ